MINKQGLWFLTLFSLILVRSIYYITMPDQMFLTNNGNVTGTDDENNSLEDDTPVSSTIDESSYLSVLKVELESTRDEQKAALEEIINSKDSTKEEKNNAYEELKTLNNNKGLEETITKKLKDDLELESFVKITNDEVEVVVEKDSHDVALASQIMNLVQQEFTDKVSVSVRFTK